MCNNGFSGIQKGDYIINMDSSGPGSRTNDVFISKVIRGYPDVMVNDIFIISGTIDTDTGVPINTYNFIRNLGPYDSDQACIEDNPEYFI